ncbi:uncharacterized protein DUF748 [Fluviicoccus keumensis]|uniref:Uncharacterized protein DUF748 n=1 Tax=Fluviicoccus keumensis TaxID=1435465 RepID=A0A4Q7Z3S4_9GAMM|nr:DUF748 domain-containing protein [Fluviicoccus keumensis]RZU44878.1 uncharacterized protein DUF748 [Fluviicoccus keumensis]
MSGRVRSISRRRKKQIAAIAGLFGLYALAGFLGAPKLVDKLARDYVHEKLHLNLAIREVQVNPLRLALRLDGVSVSEAGVKTPLLSLKSVYINVDALGSLWRRQIEVDDLDLLAPVMDARIDREGHLNLLKLVPPEDPDDKSRTNWHLAALGVHQGRIALADDSRPKPFTALLEPLNLQLHNLSSRPAGSGKYHFAAETGKGEALEWHGTVALNPVRSEGDLAIRGLQAKTVADYAQSALPLSVQAGRLSMAGHYVLLLENDTPTVRLTGGALNLEGLQAATVVEQPLQLRLDRMSMKDLSLDWPAQNLTCPELSFQKLAIGEDGPAWVSIDGVKLSRLDWNPVKQLASLKGLGVEGIRVQGDGKAPLLSVPRLEIAASTVALTPKQLQVGRVVIPKGEARFTREPGDQSDWTRFVSRLLPRLSKPQPAPAGPEVPWRTALAELALSDFRVNAEDRTPKKPVSLPLYIRQLSIHPEMDAAKPQRFEGEFDIGSSASLRVGGDLQESPLILSGHADLKGLDLPPLTPYLADFARFQLQSGKLDLNGRFLVKDAKVPQAEYHGSIGIDNFVANDLFLQERFLAWKRLQVNGLDFNLSPMKAKIREIVAEQPFSRVMILPDKSLNIAQILATTPPEASSKSTSPTKSNATVAATVDINRVAVRNGAMLFADLSLKPQFATGIEALNGEVRGVSTRPGAIADIRLLGRVDQYGKADIHGRVNPLAPDARTAMALKFDNVELTTLTPYSAKFAGYRIEKGKLSLDLDYQIENRQLKASNRIVLNQLTLGEKVESPDAVNMPLRLALALLKDGKGVIDLDLPISGSLDDPQFRVGPIVWKAFVNVVTKVATAPFRFIAGLVGGGEDMDSLAFAPGETAIRPDTRDKVLRLAQALNQRPQLRAELRGSFDPDLDRQAIRAARLDEALKARALKAPKEPESLEGLFAERFGQDALKQKKALALRPAGGQELAVAMEAYRASLRTALMDQEVVADGDLRQLALDRSRSLRQLLIDEGKVEEARVFMLEPEAASGAEGRVVSKVSLNAL